MRGFLKQLLSFLIILAVVVLGRYYYYVDFEKDVNSEVGVALHDIMPQPIKDWGCSRLSARSGQTAPRC